MLLSIEDAVEIVHSSRVAGRSVVMTAGNFDLIHFGHVEFLEQARTCGDILIVQLAGDEVVRQCKGAGRPIIPFEHRLGILLALRWVSYVIRDDIGDGVNVVRKVRPNVFIRGKDYAEMGAPESSVMEELGGSMIYATTQKLSSTEIIRRIREEIVL